MANKTESEFDIVLGALSEFRGSINIFQTIQGMYLWKFALVDARICRNDSRFQLKIIYRLCE